MNNHRIAIPFLCALLCTVGTIVPAKSDDDGPWGRPSRYFKGVKMMSYDGAVQTKGRCAIDWKAWNTAIDVVANQSVKLKLIRGDDLWEQTKQRKKTWVPKLSFVIETLELVSSCAGFVDAKVEVAVEDAKIKGTDKTLYSPSVEIWSDGSLIAGPFDTFSSFAIQTSEQIMKKLVNNWAKSQEE
jgi:hypothetical protein